MALTWVAMATIALSGCLSMPISTMWKLSRMPDNTLIVMDPAQLRTAILIDDGFAIDAARIEMKFELKIAGAAPQTRGAHLRTLEANAIRYPGLPDADKRMHWVVMALDEAGVRDLRELQAQVRAQPKGTQVSLNFSVTMKDSVAPADQAFDSELWIRWSEQGFLQFLKRVHIDPMKMAQQKK